MSTNPVARLRPLMLFALLAYAQMAKAIYDPMVGRFVNRDPIGEAGGDNLYAFVLNDPVNLIDPEGLSPNDRPFNWGAILSVSFGADSKGRGIFQGINMDVALEGACIENAKVRLDLSGNIYTGGIGTSVSSLRSGYDLAGTLSIFLGNGKSASMPVHLSNSRQVSALSNRFENSVMYGRSLNLNANMGDR